MLFRSLMFTNLLKDMIRDTDERQMNKYIGQGLGGSQVQELLSPWSWAVSPSQGGCVHQSGNFPNLTLLVFYGGFLK